MPESAAAREVECLKIVAPLLSEESEREAVPEETKPKLKRPRRGEHGREHIAMA
jgi:hypothetical protein